MEHHFECLDSSQRNRSDRADRAVPVGQSMAGDLSAA